MSIPHFRLIRIRSGLLILSIVGGIVLAGGLLAQETAKSGIKISPLTFEITADSGEVVSNNIKVSNLGDDVVSVKMEVEDFRAIGETGQVMVASEEEMTYSLKRWLEITPAEFTLEPREEKIVFFTLNIPENAEPGGHYGSVLASVTGLVGKEATGLSVIPKIGALVLLTIKGEVKEELIIKDFTCGRLETKKENGLEKEEFVPLTFFEYGPVDFRMRFENKGTVHVKPAGFIIISNWRGKNIVNIPFPQENVMPGAVRRIEAGLNEKWLIGPYTASLVVNYGASNRSLESTTISFWVIPWKMILLAVVVLVAMFILLYKTRRRWRMAMKILIRGEKGVFSK